MRAPELVRLSTACTTFDVSERTLRRLIAKGALPVHRLGPKTIRVRLDDVRALFVPTAAPARAPLRLVSPNA